MARCAGSARGTALGKQPPPRRAQLRPSALAVWSRMTGYLLTLLSIGPGRVTQAHGKQREVGTEALAQRG
jgi:hypothetical protein